ncbi:MAG: class I SAM-dependent methyltransferase [Gammaproteobacteria bacterium]|nr:class I SAM-dependent methyltransferase [Gammaproteobacteria bacterium]
MTGAHTGTEYVRAIMARESDRQARESFRALVLHLAPSGGALLDFGAGAGLDARYFAERGFRVRAYDNDPRMCEFLAQQCRDLIESGCIVLEKASYSDFLARAQDDGGRRVDVVMANFAPLNLIADLPPLFERFDMLTVPGATVVASVLNPYYIGDAKYRWWWRNLPRLWHLGRYAVPAVEGEIVRRTPADLAAQCAPAFTLERVFRGLPPRNAREAAGIAWPPCRRGMWTRLSGSRFIFLVFRKAPAGSVERASPRGRRRRPLT